MLRQPITPDDREKIWELLASDVDDAVKQVRTLYERAEKAEKELEQSRVQLAGCLTAAEGWNRNPAKQGDYGWSLSYQKTLELRNWADKHGYFPEEPIKEAPHAD
jgi:hypothetical protein